MRGGPGGAESDGARQWHHFLVAPCRRLKVRRSRRQHPRCRRPGAPAPEKTLRSLITPLKCGGTSFRHTKISQGWWVGVFSLCGRSPSGAPVSPVLAAPLFASGCAQSHAKHSPGPSDLVIWHDGEIGDVTRNGPVDGAPRTVPSSSGHRNTVLVAALSRTRHPDMDCCTTGLLTYGLCQSASLMAF